MSGSGWRLKKDSAADGWSMPTSTEWSRPDHCRDGSPADDVRACRHRISVVGESFHHDPVRLLFLAIPRVGTQVLDKGVTESVLGFSYRLTQHLLWQGYAVENLDFITGSAADFTLSTVLTYRFES